MRYVPIEEIQPGYWVNNLGTASRNTRGELLINGDVCRQPPGICLWVYKHEPEYFTSPSGAELAWAPSSAFVPGTSVAHFWSSREYGLPTQHALEHHRWDRPGDLVFGAADRRNNSWAMGPREALLPRAGRLVNVVALRGVPAIEGTHVLAVGELSELPALAKEHGAAAALVPRGTVLEGVTTIGV